MKKFFGLIVVLSLFLMVGCNSSESGYELFPETIEMMLERPEMLMESNAIPGMTIAFVDISSGFTWTHGFGYANIEQGIPVTEDTLFGIASISKIFTAIAVMQLVEQGLIDLDEPIVTYLPEFSMLPHPRRGGNYQNITTRMLLNHTSGIPMHYWGITAPDLPHLEIPILLSANDLIPFITNPEASIAAVSLNSQQPEFMNNFLINISELTMDFEEGTTFEYSNIGYTILGILVATISGGNDFFEGFNNYMNNHIIGPAAMNHSTFVMKEQFSPLMAMPYRDASMQVEETLLINDLASGAMLSTAADMARFMHIILEDGSVLLNQETLRKMMAISEPNAFGLGFYHPVNWNGIGHEGFWQHHSTMLLNPTYGIGVFISVNSESGRAVPTVLASRILESAIEERRANE